VLMVWITILANNGKYHYHTNTIFDTRFPTALFQCKIQTL
jgi:hypothetical protein